VPLAALFEHEPVSIGAVLPAVEHVRPLWSLLLITAIPELPLLLLLPVTPPLTSVALAAALVHEPPVIVEPSPAVEHLRLRWLLMLSTLIPELLGCEVVVVVELRADVVFLANAIWSLPTEAAVPATTNTAASAATAIIVPYVLCLFVIVAILGKLLLIMLV
jgi:hypothetical protein